jgi:predicted DsbA family dithiol-disulfide isomerase
LLAVSVDTEREKASKIIHDKKWTQTTNVSIDPSTLHAIGVQVLPLLIIVSQDGTIATMRGSHAINVEKVVERLLHETNKPALPPGRDGPAK